MNQRIVCAANIHPTTGVMLLGARHWDQYMHKQFDAIPLTFDATTDFVQGFIDNKGNFLNRTVAWKIAEAEGQIIRRCGGDTTDGGTLYSENLY
jgi:hypothetical protein